MQRAAEQYCAYLSLRAVEVPKRKPSEVAIEQNLLFVIVMIN